MNNTMVESEDDNIMKVADRAKSRTIIHENTVINYNHPFGILKCALCLKDFLTLSDLEIHLTHTHYSDDLLKETNSSPSKCGICEKVLYNPRGESKKSFGLIISHLAFKHGLLKQLVPSKLAETQQLYENLQTKRSLCRIKSEKSESYSGYSNIRSQPYYKLKPDTSLPKVQKKIRAEKPESPSGDSEVQHQCIICPQEFRTWPILKRHLAQVHFKEKMLAVSGSTMEKCGICGTSFSTTALKKDRQVSCHLAFQHKLLEQLIPEDYKALQLGQRRPPSENLQNLTEEISKNSAKASQKWICYLCLRDFKTLDLLQNHLVDNHFESELLKRSGSSKGKCGICAEVSGINTSIPLHLAFTHGLLKKMSPENFETLYSFDPEVRQQCLLCLNDYKSLGGLKRHLTMDHFKDELLNESGSYQDFCGICNKQIKTYKHVSTQATCLTWHLAYFHGLLEKKPFHRFKLLKY